MNRVLALARRVVLFEISLYRSLFRWVTRRYDVPPGAERYPYVGAVSVLLWAFIVVSAVELVVLHVILPWEVVRLIAAIGVRERGRERSRALQVDRADDGTVLNVVIASRTNVDVTLRRPLSVLLPHGEETVTEVRLFADDARALVRRAREHLEATSTR